MSGGSDGATGLGVGDEVEVEVGRVAHGGHCVARHEGQVLFVRHTLPGERVRARVTEVGSGARYVRADAVEVLTASPDRVEPPCPWAGPDRCGGCDLQHVALPRQRALKAEVVAEQLQRLAGLTVDVDVEPVPGAAEGLGWRTRVEFAVGEDGVAGLRKHRSHDIVPVDRCRIAAPGVAALEVTSRAWPGEEAVDAVAPSAGEPVVVPVPSDAVPDVRERVTASWSSTAAGTTVAFDREFAVSARGFWQVHPGAAATFLAAAMAGLDVRPGERALDLYSGVGLFAAALGESVGPRGQVVAVEADAAAVARATAGLADLPWVLPVQARVDDAFGVPRPTKGGPRRRTGRSASAHPVAAAADERRRRRPRPPAGRRRHRGGPCGRGTRRAGDRLRGVRPRGAGPRHRSPAGGRVPPREPAGLRCVPDDAPRGMRRPLHQRRL